MKHWMVAAALLAAPMASQAASLKDLNGVYTGTTQGTFNGTEYSGECRVEVNVGALRAKITVTTPISPDTFNDTRLEVESAWRKPVTEPLFEYTQAPLIVLGSHTEYVLKLEFTNRERSQLTGVRMQRQFILAGQIYPIDHDCENLRKQ